MSILTANEIVHNERVEKIDDTVTKDQRLTGDAKCMERFPATQLMDCDRIYKVSIIY